MNLVSNFYISLFSQNSLATPLPNASVRSKLFSEMILSLKMEAEFLVEKLFGDSKKKKKNRTLYVVKPINSPLRSKSKTL